MPSDNLSGDDPLQEVIASFLDALAAGHSPDREQLLAAHPDRADELRAFFAGHDRMTQAAVTVRAALGLDPSRSAPSAEGFPQTFGDYELLEELGRGGMGVVYRARQKSLNRTVALKMILAGRLANEKEVQRFRGEAEAAAQLDHPNIVPIYEVGEHDGQDFFTMKLIDGESLAQCLSRYQGNSKEIACLIATVARAVHHAHQRGILHRDLKPGNILIDREGQPHVADFGLSKRLNVQEEATQSGAIIGTAEYMSPEQARGEKLLSTVVDVYGLGAVLYYLLAGRPPFTGDNLLEILNQVTEEEPKRLPQMNGTVPRDLETICLKCLRKDPSKRYGSTEEVAEDLERWLRGEPIQARSAGRAERLVKWVRRRPALAGLITTAVLLLLTLTVGGPLVALHQANLRRTAEKATEDAFRQKAVATSREAEAVAARQEVERMLIRNLLRPLGHRDAPPTPLEAEALLELAGLPSDDVRLRFLETGLESLSTAERVGRRADMAASAAVGLDLQKREQVLNLLNSKVQDPKTDAAIKRSCVLFAIELETNDPALLRAGAAELLAEAGRTQPLLAPWVLVEKLDGVLSRMPPREARPVARDAARMIIARLEQARVFHRNQALIEVLALMTRRMEPEEATRMLLTQMAQNKMVVNDRYIQILRGALTAVAGKLNPKTAGEIAQMIFTQMEQIQLPLELRTEHRMFGSLARNLSLDDRFISSLPVEPSQGYRTEVGTETVPRFGADWLPRPDRDAAAAASD